jgi:hypothetical protein
MTDAWISRLVVKIWCFTHGRCGSKESPPTGTACRNRGESVGWELNCLGEREHEALEFEKSLQCQGSVSGYRRRTMGWGWLRRAGRPLAARARDGRRMLTREGHQRAHSLVA